MTHREILYSGRSSVTLEVSDNKPYIAFLAGRTGQNAATGSVLPLPAGVTADGRFIAADWTFISVERSEGTANGAETETLRLLFADGKAGLRYTVTCTARTGLEGPFEFTSELKNESGGVVSFSPGCFFEARAAMPATAAWTFKKESGQAEGFDHKGLLFEGSGIYVTPMEDGASVTAWVSTFQNFNASGYMPMIYLDSGGKRGVYFALEWSAGRVHAASATGAVRLSADMDGIDALKSAFTTKIADGEAFLLPAVYLGAYTGDVDDGSNIFKHWFFACKAPRILRENENEPLTQMDMQIGPDVGYLGVESVKWDYGWWSDDVTVPPWRSLEGSWVCRSRSCLNTLASYGGSLGSFGRYAASLPVNLTVYVLLHDTLDKDGDPTDAYGEFNSVTHPEWFSGRRITDGMGRSADLGDTECVNYLKDALLSFFKENRIPTWRTDFEPVCFWSDKENRHAANGSDTQYWCTRGFLEITDHLYENYDGFRYESCSSGGSMKDLLTATRAVVINCDDSANYLSLRTTFYDSSFCICPAQLQLPCNPDTFCAESAHFWPEISSGQTDLTDALKDMGFRSMLPGALMFGSWSGPKDGELQFGLGAYYAKYYKFYTEKVRPLVREGELYHILPRPDGINWDGVMYADPDSRRETKGIVFLFKPSEKAESSVRVRLRGLYPGTVYRLSFVDGTSEDITAAGGDLTEAGIEVKIGGIGSEIILITESADR